MTRKPRIKGAIINGYHGHSADSFEFNDDLETGLKKIIRKYGIPQNKLYDIAIVYSMSAMIATSASLFLCLRAVGVI